MRRITDLNLRYPHGELTRLLGQGAVVCFSVDYSIDPTNSSSSFDSGSDSDFDHTEIIVVYEIQPVSSSTFFEESINTNMDSDDLNALRKDQKEKWDECFRDLARNRLIIDCPKVDKFEQRKMLLHRSYSPPFMLCDEDTEFSDVLDFVLEYDRVVFKGKGARGEANIFIRAPKEQSYSFKTNLSDLYSDLIDKHCRIVVEAVVMFPPVDADRFNAKKVRPGAYYRDVVFYDTKNDCLLGVYEVYRSVLNVRQTTNSHTADKQAELHSESFLLSHDPEELECAMRRRKQCFPELYKTKERAFLRIARSIEQYVMSFEHAFSANDNLSRFVAEIFPYPHPDAYYAFFQYHWRRPSDKSSDLYFTVRRQAWNICKARDLTISDSAQQNNHQAIADQIFQYISEKTPILDLRQCYGLLYLFLNADQQDSFLNFLHQAQLLSSIIDSLKASVIKKTDATATASKQVGPSVASNPSHLWAPPQTASSSTDTNRRTNQI